jgi:glycosyltransferase involved in cell wall biosynthesis
MRLKRWLIRRTRAALLRYVRGSPRAADREGAEKRVFILLVAAWGMGGTIRTTLNLAGYLASQGWEVEILSIGRGRDEPFFGAFPEGVDVVVLDDKRPSHEPSRLHPLRRWMRKQSSVVMHPEDRAARGFNLWVDWKLVRRLRGRSGFLIGTRPGLNMLAAELAPPGMALVGQEHMNLREHPEILQKAVKRRYPALDALSVLTERDRDRYSRHLRARIPVVRIPNTVRDMGGVHADLSSKTVLAAGRLTRQKGYDRLVRAWAPVAEQHPDWHLRICGEGPMQAKLEGIIERLELQDSVTLAGPSKDLGAEMAKASIFVLSSRWEGLPLVLLEAMSVGMAVVSFDCPTGPADVVDDHRNGLLIRPRKVAMLTAGIEEMIEDEELRRRCSAGAVETAAGYSMDVVGPRWEAFLHDTWEQRHRSMQ